MIPLNGGIHHTTFNFNNLMPKSLNPLLELLELAQDATIISTTSVCHFYVEIPRHAARDQSTLECLFEFE